MQVYLRIKYLQIIELEYFKNYNVYIHNLFMLLLQRVNKIMYSSVYISIWSEHKMLVIFKTENKS